MNRCSPFGPPVSLSQLLTFRRFRRIIYKHSVEFLASARLDGYLLGFGLLSWDINSPSGRDTRSMMPEDNGILSIVKYES